MEMFWAVPSDVPASKVKKMADRIGFVLVDSRQRGEFTDYKLSDKIQKPVGQPKKDITKEEILALRKKGNSMYAIAKMLGVSRKTLYNRIGEKPRKRFPL